MVAIPGVRFTGTAVPSDTGDTYPVIDPVFGIDGWRAVANAAARNAIPDARRRQGMIVYQIDTGVMRQLNAPPWTGVDGDWTVVAFGGGGAVLTGNLLYVDAVNGNNATAVRGDFTKPYLTIAAAVTAALVGDTIVIRPGAYTSAASIQKDGIGIYCMPGVTISYTNTLFGAPAANNTSFSFTGYARLIATAASSRLIDTTGAFTGINWIIEAISHATSAANNATGMLLSCQGNYSIAFKASAAFSCATAILDTTAAGATRIAVSIADAWTNAVGGRIAQVAAGVVNITAASMTTPSDFCLAIIAAATVSGDLGHLSGGGGIGAFDGTVNVDCASIASNGIGIQVAGTAIATIRCSGGIASTLGDGIDVSSTGAVNIAAGSISAPFVTGDAITDSAGSGVHIYTIAGALSAGQGALIVSGGAEVECSCYHSTGGINSLGGSYVTLRATFVEGLAATGTGGTLYVYAESCFSNGECFQNNGTMFVYADSIAAVNRTLVNEGGVMSVWADTITSTSAQAIDIDAGSIIVHLGSTMRGGANNPAADCDGDRLEIIGGEIQGGTNATEVIVVNGVTDLILKQCRVVGTTNGAPGIIGNGTGRYEISNVVIVTNAGDSIQTNTEPVFVNTPCSANNASNVAGGELVQAILVSANVG